MVTPHDLSLGGEFSPTPYIFFCFIFVLCMYFFYINCANFWIFKLKYEAGDDTFVPQCNLCTSFAFYSTKKKNPPVLENTFKRSLNLNLKNSSLIIYENETPKHTHTHFLPSEAPFLSAHTATCTHSHTHPEWQLSLYQTPYSAATQGNE